MDLNQQKNKNYKLEMPTTNYDSQVITQRIQAKVNANFFATAKAANVSIQRPATSLPTQDFVNEVVSGSITTYTKLEGVFGRDLGCNCASTPTPKNVVELNVDRNI